MILVPGCVVGEVPRSPWWPTESPKPLLGGTPKEPSLTGAIHNRVLTAFFLFTILAQFFIKDREEGFLTPGIYEDGDGGSRTPPEHEIAFRFLDLVDFYLV